MPDLRVSFLSGALLLLASTAAAEGPPFTDDKAADAASEDDASAKSGPKPKVRIWNVEKEAGDDKYIFQLAFTPGIPKADELIELVMTANIVPERPHPRYGRKVPIEGAKVVVELRDAGGRRVGKYLAHKAPLSRDKYHLHMTPARSGIHTLSVTGKAKDVEFEFEVKVPVDVWPLPEDLRGTGAATGQTGRRRPLKL